MDGARARGVLALTLLVAIAACGDRAAGPAAPPPSPAPALDAAAAPSPPSPAPAAALDAAAAPDAAAAAAPRDPRRWDCTTDADCRNSCEHGAVSAAWYARAEVVPGFDECEDGCADQLAAPPRCEAGGCAAYQVDPQDSARITPRPSCTRRAPAP